MHSGSWRADLHREGEDGQRTDKVRPALERLAAGPDCNRDACSALWPLSAEELRGHRQVRLCPLALCVAAQGFSTVCLLRTLRTFGCMWYRGCAVKTCRAHQ